MRTHEKIAVSVMFLMVLGGCGTTPEDSADEVAGESSALFGKAFQIGVFRGGGWFLDSNGDNAWNGTPTDSIGLFGQAGDIPVVDKNCNPTAPTRRIFVTRGPSQWFATANDFDWNAGDSSFQFGFTTGPMFPVMLNGHIAAVRTDVGQWIWDTNDDHVFGITDRNIQYGSAQDIPVAGRWVAGATERPGAFRNGLWTVDSNGNYSQDAGDAQFTFGMTGDWPVVADFNVNHAGDEVAVFRNGAWLVDFNGNRSWDDVGGGDKMFFFGQAGDLPVVAGPTWTSAMCIK